MGQAEKRDADRSKVMLMAVVRFEHQPGSHRLRVRDISAGGARLSFAGPVRAGDLAWIELPALGEVEGEVAWVAGGEIGIRFECAIDPVRTRLAVTGDFSAPPPPPPATGLRRI